MGRADGELDPAKGRAGYQQAAAALTGWARQRAMADPRAALFRPSSTTRRRRPGLDLRQRHRRLRTRQARRADRHGRNRRSRLLLPLRMPRARLHVRIRAAPAAWVVHGAISRASQGPAVVVRSAARSRTMYAVAPAAPDSAARRMGSSRAAASGLLGVVRDFQRLGPTETLRQLNLAGSGRTTGGRCLRRHPGIRLSAGRRVDDAIARQAMLETIGDMAECGCGQLRHTYAAAASGLSSSTLSLVQSRAG